MKFPRFLVCAVLGLGFVSAARAQDAKGNLTQAVEALQSAPAFRMKIASTDLDTKQSNSAVLEKVNPDSLHMRMEEDGHVKMEFVTDGKATYFRRGEDAKFEEVPPAMSAMVNSLRQSVTPEVLLQSATDVKMAGHETIAGTPTTIVTFDTDRMGVKTTAKMWIADQDHRPIKTEGDTTGEMKMGARAGHKVNRHSTTTYEYDPAIKIVVPPTP